jgi:hypothetical protein
LRAAINRKLTIMDWDTTEPSPGQELTLAGGTGFHGENSKRAGGGETAVAEVLNRRRPLTIDMIRKLNKGLGISADVLIRPYSVRGSAA